MSIRTSLAVVILTLAWCSCGFATSSEQFEKANAFYEAKAYDSAVVAYESILDSGVESAALYFNLGNACFRQQDIGHAVLYYLKARRLDPTDQDIADNLEFAGRFTSVHMEGVKLNPIESFFDSLVDPYRLAVLAWVTTAFLALFFIFLTLRFGLRFQGLAVRGGVIISLAVLLVMSLMTTVKYNTEYLTERGVVIAEDSIVRTGPSNNSEKELAAAPGLVVEILSESGDFYNVLFENKRRGWIQKDLVAVI